MARQSLVRRELTEQVIRSASKVDPGLEVDARRLGRWRNDHCDRPSELSIQPVSVFCANAWFNSVYMDVRLFRGFLTKSFLILDWTSDHRYPMFLTCTVRPQR